MLPTLEQPRTQRGEQGDETTVCIRRGTAGASTMPSPRSVRVGHSEETLARPHTVGCRCPLPAPYETNAFFHMSPLGAEIFPASTRRIGREVRRQRWAQRLLP